MTQILYIFIYFKKYSTSYAKNLRGEKMNVNKYLKLY